MTKYNEHASLSHTHTRTHTHTFSIRKHSMSVLIRTIWEDKQEQNITIPAKNFCRVQESMQEIGQMRRKSSKDTREEGEKRESKREWLDHEKT